MYYCAAHKFFANGQLLVTCCYFDILHRWQPILLSWIGRQTTETYASHFFTLFNSIAYGFKVKNEEYFTLATFQQVLGTVVDFSESQRTGFQMAYAKFLTTTQFGCELQLKEWSRNILSEPFTKFTVLSFDDHYIQAATFLHGCIQH